VYAGEDSEHSTKNMVQTYPNAYERGPLWATVTRRPMPRMEKGADDSMTIATILVYIQDISGPSSRRKSARIRRRRKQIIEVTMMFKLTLREIHGRPPRSVPFRMG